MNAFDFGDPLSATNHQDVVYVADRELNIVQVNEHWRAFAGENNGESLLGEDWNRNLLANFSGSERVRWKAIYSALLDGRLPRHTEQFQCPSPIERRRFLMVIEPVVDSEGIVTHLVHRTIRRPAESLAKVNVVEAYRHEVLERPARASGLLRAVQLQPLEKAGGDFTWEKSHGRMVDAVIGDFVGHGRGAAAHAVHAVRWLDAAASPDDPISDVVRRLNHSCAQWAEDSVEVVFATGLYMRADLDSETIEICSFGHASPIFSQAGELALDGGMPVGLLPSETDWPTQRFDVATHGRRFLTYSDGVSEQFDEAGVMFGSERITALFGATLERPLGAQVQKVFNAVDAFRGSALIKDDRAVMILEFPGRTKDRGARRAGHHRTPRVWA